MATKQEIVSALSDTLQETEKLVASIPEGGWSKPAYENGW
ncbi:MAG: wyosine base formation domain-containing protein, partial [Chloroflexi bacterium]|nr:wyosine base formation domain-containing protein [Chloroflexota bacterium]